MFAIETFAMSETILLNCFNDLVQLLHLAKRIVFVLTEGPFLPVKLVEMIEQSLESVIVVIKNR